MANMVDVSVIVLLALMQCLLLCLALPLYGCSPENIAVVIPLVVGRNRMASQPFLRTTTAANHWCTASDNGFCYC
jgi:hypothetical protein